jgi:hypothetical protein
MYKEETGFKLNYFTLKISDPVIANELFMERGIQYAKVAGAVTAAAVLNLLSQSAAFFLSASLGNPMKLITSALGLLVMVVDMMMIKFKKSQLVPFMTVPYLLVHVIGTICVYKEWVPSSFLKFPKETFEFQIVQNFIIVNSVPLLDIKYTLFLMVPILLISSFL